MSVVKERGYSLQANAKTIEGNQHADRDVQFAYLNDQANDHLEGGDAGRPVTIVCRRRQWRR